MSVRYAVYQALAQLGQGAGAVSYDVYGIEPVDMPVSNRFAPGAYSVVNGAVVGKYGTTENSPMTDYKQTLQLQVKNGPLLTRGQWEDLGMRAKSVLESQYMAQVTSIIIA
ncbi:hypothetical protein AAVH_09935 [Aphelenchoides avenae]|nr:hypothetical protein AAVH_09935 [Aphelenchus avenae]